MDDKKEEAKEQTEKQTEPVMDETADAKPSESAKAAEDAEKPETGKAQESGSADESAATPEQDGASDSKEEPKPAADDVKSAEKPSDDSSDQKGIFGRRKKEKDKRDQQIEDLTDRCQRQMAEFDNFRKRSEKEKSAMFEMGERSVLEKILPTVDNFERGLSSLDEEKKNDAFAQGMEKTYRQLVTALEGIGVKPIEAVGQPFDPNFHNAVQHVDDEDAGENIVVEEFQKGYMYRDTVLRHSMVKVAN